MTLLARQYWKTAAMAAAGYLGDTPLFLLDYVLRLLRVAALLSVWRMLLGGGASAGGLTLPALLTYTLAAELFAGQLNPRTGLDWALWQGTIVGRMLQPLHIVGVVTAEMAGRWLFELCAFSLPLLLLAPLLGVQPLPASPAAGALFAVSLTLGVSVGVALEFIFAALLVIFELPLWAIFQIRLALTTLLSGALVPLALLPPAVAAAFAWLPFAAMASAPLQIYVGAGDAALLIAGQAAWSVALWALARWLWRLGRERMVSYGG